MRGRPVGANRRYARMFDTAMSGSYGESPMSRARRLVATIAAIWLSCQLTATVLTPIVLSVDVETRAVVCTCPPGADAHCPMHHKAQRRSKTCVMQGINDRAAGVLVSMLGVSGLTPESSFLGQPV